MGRRSWDLDQTVDLAKVLKKHGVDLMDVSTGGMIPGVTIPVKPDYQVPFAEQVRSRAEIPTTAVGLITKPKQAKKILKSGAADASKSDVRRFVIRIGLFAPPTSSVFRPKMRPTSRSMCVAHTKRNQ